MARRRSREPPLGEGFTREGITRNKQRPIETSLPLATEVRLTSPTCRCHRPSPWPTIFRRVLVVTGPGKTVKINFLAGSIEWTYSPRSLREFARWIVPGGFHPRVGPDVFVMDESPLRIPRSRNAIPCRRWRALPRGAGAGPSDQLRAGRHAVMQQLSGGSKPWTVHARKVCERVRAASLMASQAAPRSPA
jgi:hypothetical protein